MLKDAEILSQLMNTMGDQEAIRAFIRLQWVPEAWKALRDPAFFDQAMQTLFEREITPASLADLVLEREGWRQRAPEDPAWQAEIERALQVTQDATEPDTRALKDVAILGVYLTQIRASAAACERWAQAPGASYLRWASPLACAWPHLQHPAHIVQSLMRTGDPKAIYLALHTLELFASETERVEALKAFTIEDWLRVLSIDDLMDLAHDGAQFEEQDLLISASEPLLGRALRSALRASEEGNLEAARQGLTQAWEIRNQQRALISDALATIARREGDPLLEIEARRQSLDAHPTPARRAALAACLFVAGRSEQALEIVRSMDDPAAYILAGVIHLHLGDRASAASSLRSGYQAVTRGDLPLPSWLARLADGLRQIGATRAAARTLQHLTAFIPDQAEERLRLARLLFELEDYSGAGEQAELLLVMDKANLEARQLLAECLQSAGDAEGAMTHWKAIADHRPQAKLSLGECALQAKRPELAREAAEFALAENPQDTRAMLLMGKALFASGEVARARSLLERAVEIDPQDPQVWISLANSQAELGERQAAGLTLERGLAHLPRDASLHMARARWLRAQGMPSEALDHTAKAVEISPESASWLLEHADLLRELGHTDEAEAVARKVLAREPENWQAQAQLARTYEAAGKTGAAAKALRFEPHEVPPDSCYHAGRILAKAASTAEEANEALRYLEGARERGAQAADLDYWRAEALSKAGDFEAATVVYQGYLDQLADGDSSHALEAVQGLARAALECKQPALAISRLEHARQAFPTSLELLLLLSHAYRADGNHDHAYAIAKQAAELNPTSPKALEAFRARAEEAGHLDEALYAQTKLASLQPEQAEAWIGLARIRWSAGQADQARTDLAKGIRLATTKPDALASASEVAIQHDRPRLALRLLRKAANLAPSDEVIQTKLAVIAEKAGDLDTAQQAWLTSARLTPCNAEALSRAAESLWRLNRRTSAIGLWQQAVALSPDQPSYKAALGRAFMAVGQRELGLRQYMEAFKADPSLELQLEIARAMADSGLPEEGLALLQSEPARSSTHISKLEVAAECCLRMGDPKGAVEIAEYAQSLTSLTPTLLAVQALAAAQRGKADLAAEALKTLKSMEPSKDPRAWSWQIEAALGLCQWEKAAARALESAPVQPSLEAAMMRIKAALRLFEMEWLFGELGKSTRHSPASAHDLPTWEQVDTWIDACSGLGAMPQAITTLRAWRQLVSGDVRPEEVDFGTSLPALPEAAIRLSTAIALLRANRPTKALVALQKIASAASERGFDHLVRALAAQHSGDERTHAESLEHACRHVKLHPLARYFESRYALAQNERGRALEALNAAVAAWADEAEWHFELAGIYMAEQKPEAALPHLQAASELEPANPRYLAALARQYRALGQIAEAKTVYQHIVHTSPTSPVLWREAAEVALAAGEAAQAEAWFERANALAPSDAMAMMGAAKAAAKQGKSRLALKRAQMAFQMAPQNPAVLSGLGEILAAEGKFEKAIQVYDQALRNTDHDPELRLARSRLLVLTGQFEEAIADLEQILQEDQDRHQAWNLLAEAHEKQGDLPAALRAAQQAVRIAPRVGAYQVQLGRISRLTGQLDQALDVLSKAHEAFPDSADIARELGKVYEERRQPARALEAYQKAIAIDPEDVEALFMASMLLKQQKAYEAAAEYLERAAKLDTTNAETHQQLAAVRALQLVHGGIEAQAVAS